MFFGIHQDLGAGAFKTWTEKQRHEEIEKLVEGYRNGLPADILCKMTETIAGSRKSARKLLKALMPLAERKTAVEKAAGDMQPLVRSFLL
jgi:hypothetical protein